MFLCVKGIRGRDRSRLTSIETIAVEKYKIDRIDPSLTVEMASTMIYEK
jgi:hypothetical protein